MPIVEWICAWIPPIPLGKIRGEVQGHSFSGYIIGLPDTHRVILNRSPEHTYRKVVRAGRWAERKGARIMGLGAYTSVAGDAGVTVAKLLEIGITTGNALSAWASFETLKEALTKVGSNLSQSRVAIFGATGSIGEVMARLIAPDVRGLYLVSRTQEKLENLKKSLTQEYPSLEVDLDVEVRPETLRKCDAVISATSSAVKPVVSPAYLAPGTVVVDIAQPPDFPEQFARERPDCLFLEAGEVKAPPTIRLGFSLPLPDGLLYGCLGETILLALEGHYQDFCVGRTILEDQVRWIGERATAYGFTPAPLTQFGKLIKEEELKNVRKARNSHT